MNWSDRYTLQPLWLGSSTAVVTLACTVCQHGPDLSQRFLGWSLGGTFTPGDLIIPAKLAGTFGIRQAGLPQEEGAGLLCGQAGKRVGSVACLR